MKDKNNKTNTFSTNLSKTDTSGKKAAYRTSRKAGDTAQIPDRLPIITNTKYQNALTPIKNDTAYLQPITSVDSLKYENGTLSYRDLPITSAALNSLIPEHSIEKINLPLLRALYGIILNNLPKVSLSNPTLNNVFTIYYPDFARKTGKSSNIGKNDINEFAKNIEHFKTVLGVISNGTKSGDILPVLTDIKIDSGKNTISFASPYIVRLIGDIYKTSIRKSKKGEPLLKKNGEPQMSPSYSYLIDMSIVKERNRKAVEIVFIVVTLIEQAGNNTPHIRAKTIIERNSLLSKSLQGQSCSNKNILLKRAFKKAWELLNNKTYLATSYKNIHLPDPENDSDIPISTTLDMVFKFPHEGKIKTPQS